MQNDDVVEVAFTRANWTAVHSMALQYVMDLVEDGHHERAREILTNIMPVLELASGHLILAEIDGRLADCVGLHEDGSVSEGAKELVRLVS